MPLGSTQPTDAPLTAPGLPALRSKMAVCQANSETSPAGHRGGATTADHQPLLPNEAPFARFAIGFFTSYSHVDIPSHESVAINQQIGIPLLLAAMAALVEP